MVCLRSSAALTDGHLLTAPDQGEPWVTQAQRESVSNSHCLNTLRKDIMEDTFHMQGIFISIFITLSIM